MRLGSRWSVGSQPPARLPADLIEEIRRVEARLSPEDAATLRWTLSWIEGRPIAELDDGTVLRG